MNKIRYQTCIAITILLILSINTCLAEKKIDKLVFASPFTPLIMPMAYIVEHDLLKEFAHKSELIIWNTPDQLRTMITREDADFVSVPSNTAAIFYNKGVKLKLLRVSIWGVFYIISNDFSIHSLENLKGEKVYIPFRGDQPDLIFQSICLGYGLNPFEDFHIQYVNSPLDITMGLLAGRIKHALMIEPGAALALSKAEQKGMAFKRVIDIQNEWGIITGHKKEFPNAGVIALPKILKHPELVKIFAEAYDTGVKWVNNYPAKASKLAAKYVKGINAPIFEESLKYTILKSVSGKNSQKEVELMFNYFMKLNPKSVGNRLPDENFYY